MSRTKNSPNHRIKAETEKHGSAYAGRSLQKEALLTCETQRVTLGYYDKIF